MKEKIQSLILESLKQLLNQEVITQLPNDIKIEHTKDKSHGDYATNIAMVLCKQAKTNPQNLAKQIIANISDNNAIEKINIAGAGFINFFINEVANNSIIEKILEEGDKFGQSNIGNGQKVLLEFVSANPTGPLHVGHGRGAALGASLSNLLREVGFVVDNEYYVNDAGRQMDILTISIWLRYLMLFGIDIDFPSNGYKGSYIIDIANKIKQNFSDTLVINKQIIYNKVSPDDYEGGDKEKHIDDLISQAKSLLSLSDYQTIFETGLDFVLNNIKNDLYEFGVEFEQYFSESSLAENGLNKKTTNLLKDKNTLYEKNGAIWFKTTDYDDEKDRVVIRDNGEHTYFASDIAYHYEKFNRGYDKIINIWGADHHGYIPRVKASIKALGFDENKLEILLVQFATLYRGKVKVPMSTRSGSFVTLRELREEVGNDATRFFYILRKSEQHMDFDLELAKSQTNDNPVFYIQYAHARICRVFQNAQEKDLITTLTKIDLSLLNSKEELALIKTLNRYCEVIEKSAIYYEPHTLAYYLKQLATDFHSYYNASTFLDEDENIRHSRLSLIKATKQVIKNGLNLLGVRAPDYM
ncbi:Arginyl-tRNA synthetase [hydrothermal vent metagenome]|uniref:arginine--tRNA ligase n=1 Tax=hydrothermal vent metagenome TaxID=652676 RepID=A0A1W1CHT9_9ZZZZ